MTVKSPVVMSAMGVGKRMGLPAGSPVRYIVPDSP